MTKSRLSAKISREVVALHYKNYQKMRDATWNILLDSKVARLPINVDAICRQLGVRVLSYDVGAEVIERAHLYRAVRHAAGLTFYLHDTPVILFDETRPFPEILFTVAHELGHLVLCHVNPGGITPVHRGTGWSDNPEETAANQFAARLLAPACVLWGLNVHSPEEIMSLCQVTRPAAEYRARRMGTLYQRQRFLTSPLERAVHNQFRPYISRVAPPHCCPEA